MKKELLYTTPMPRGGYLATFGCYRVAPAPTLDELDQRGASQSLAWRDPSTDFHREDESRQE